MNTNSHRQRPRRLSFRLLDLPVSVVCHDPSLADALQWFLSPFAGRAGDGVTIDIRPDTSQSDRFVYLRNGVTTRTGGARRILRHALWDIHGSVLEDTNDFLFLHASAVSRRGGLLLPGGEEAGKSTLAAALLLEGFAYLSDELGVLTIDDTNDVLPYPKILTLMPESLEHLPEIAQRLTDRDEGWPNLPDRYVRADQLGARPSAPVSARWVAFLSRDRAGPPRLTPVGRARCLHLLGEHCLNLDRHGRRGLQRLTRLAEDVQAFALTGGTPVERARVLSKLVGDGDGGPGAR